MVSGPEDDFSTFLEFGDLQLNFSHFDGHTQNREEMQDGSGGPSMDLQTSNDAVGAMGFPPGNIHHFTDPTVMADFNPSSNLFSPLDMPSQMFEQQQQPRPIQQPRSYGQPYLPHNMIPQTPNSIEMHGGKTQYHPAAPHNHARAMHEHYRYPPNGQTTFTPLVSPAVTPHDGKFRYPDYAVPGEYFSPLTSPALEAQNHATQRPSTFRLERYAEAAKKDLKHHPAQPLPDSTAVALNETPDEKETNDEHKYPFA
ncbi:MAG: hypothetical protein Q9196_007209 [Gyalolechia fulgens]